MRILVTGAGHSGTCLVTEFVRTLGMVDFSSEVEDREIFIANQFPDNYGTKLTTEWDTVGYTEYSLKNMLDRYEDLHIIFCIRNPIDVCMSKIVRSDKSIGDNSRIVGKNGFEFDPDVAIKSIKSAFSMYCMLKDNYSTRTYTAKLEDFIEDHRGSVLHISNYFSVPYPGNEIVDNAVSANRNKYQKERYGDKVKKDQIDIYKRWEQAYDGYFSKKKILIDKIMFELTDIGNRLGYNILLEEKG